jgi:hypothetical protein
MVTLDTVTPTADIIEVTMAYSVAPTEGSPDAIVAATTCYFDDSTTQEYIDGLVIGKSAEDQLQWLNGQGGFAFADIGPDQAPRLEFELNVMDWQEVGSSERDQLEPGSAVQGNNPPTVRGMGGFFLGDFGSTTRTVYKVQDVSINPGVAYEPLPGYNGINGIEGFQKVIDRPTIEFTALLEGGADPLPGFYDDFNAGTAKQMLIQFGTSQQNTVAVSMYKCYFDAAPVRVEAGALQGVRCVLHGESVYDSNDTDKLAQSPICIHWF